MPEVATDTFDWASQECPTCGFHALGPHCAKDCGFAVCRNCGSYGDKAVVKDKRHWFHAIPRQT